MNCIQSGAIELGRIPISFNSFQGFFDLFFWGCGLFCFFFPQENISRYGPEGQYHAKPIQHLKTMRITAMGQHACPYLISVSTGE